MRPGPFAVARLLAAAIALLLTACGASAASSTAHARPPCGPRGAKTLAASHTARVYLDGVVVSGCSAHGSTSYQLGRHDSCINSVRIDPVVVTADMTAYGAERCGIDTGNTSVTVLRLTDGKQLASVPATSPPGVESFQRVDSLVLKSNGSAAWIAEGSSIVSHGHRLIEVRKFDKRGESLLDSGTGVRTDSLRLHRSTLRWRDGTQTGTATLH
jgi:hypothetical protein